MNIYWYWPFPARGENPLAMATMRRGDRLTLHSLASQFGIPIRGQSIHYEARRELPESPRSRWALITRAGAAFRRTRRRRRVVAAGDFDICHIHSLNHFMDPWALLRLGRPLVVTVHDVLPHTFRLPERLERRFLSKLYGGDRILVVAHKRLKRQLVAEFSVDAGRVAVVPLPIHRSLSNPSARNGDPVVLFFGSFRTNKGVPVLLEAIRRLPASRQVRFHFAGRGAPAVERLVREAAHSDPRISAEIGFVTNERKVQLFSDASLVVLPYTNFSSQSGVLQDAYAFGTPVVTTDVGALGESVRNDGTGWVVRPGDPDALAEVLARAIDDDEGRSRARRAADGVARERTVEEVGRRLRTLYEDVVAGRTPFLGDQPAGAPRSDQTNEREVST